MVREFHEACGLPVGRKPRKIDDERALLRLRLIAEEVAELVCAMSGRDERADLLAHTLDNLFAGEWTHGSEDVDLAAIAKEACDVHVVVSGTCVEYGLPEDDVYVEVHRSNMAKADGPMRADGKKLKPKGWTPADVAAVLEDA